MRNTDLIAKLRVSVEEDSGLASAIENRSRPTKTWENLASRLGVSGTDDLLTALWAVAEESENFQLALTVASATPTPPALLLEMFGSSLLLDAAKVEVSPEDYEADEKRASKLEDDSGLARATLKELEAKLHHTRDKRFNPATPSWGVGEKEAQRRIDSHEAPDPWE